MSSGLIPGGFNQTGTSAVAGDRWLGGHFLYSLQQCQLPQFQTELSLHFHYRSSSSSSSSASCWLAGSSFRMPNQRPHKNFSSKLTRCTNTAIFRNCVIRCLSQTHTHSLLLCRLAQLTHSKINIEINIYLGTLFQIDDLPLQHCTQTHTWLWLGLRKYTLVQHAPGKPRARCCWISLP